MENFTTFEEKISPEVQADILKIRKHWLVLRNKKIDNAASRINDIYLKSNKIEKGVMDYHGVVKYVMDVGLDSTFLHQ